MIAKLSVSAWSDLPVGCPFWGAALPKEFMSVAKPAVVTLRKDRRTTHVATIQNVRARAEETEAMAVYVPVRIYSTGHERRSSPEEIRPRCPVRLGRRNTRSRRVVDPGSTSTARV